MLLIQVTVVRVLLVTLQDYLNSSIEKVYLIVIALLFATISSYLARRIMREKQKFRHRRLVRNVIINTENCIILETNSSYFFFYDESLSKAYVIPKDGISYIEANR